MAELAREDVKEVIEEVSPAIVKEVIEEVSPTIVKEVVQEVTPGIVKAVILEVVPGIVDEAVEKSEFRIVRAVNNSFKIVDTRLDRLEVDMTQVKTRLGRVEGKLNDMVTPAQHRSLSKRVEALEDKDR